MKRSIRDQEDLQEWKNKVMKTREAAKYLAVSPWKLRNLVHAGKLAYISDGDSTSAMRFLVEDLDDYLSRCRIPVAPEFSASAA